jgi:hypothetical protein
MVMTKTPSTFPEIVTKLNALSDELKRSNNPSERRILLRRFRVLLDEADAAAIRDVKRKPPILPTSN